MIAFTRCRRVHLLCEMRRSFFSFTPRCLTPQYVGSGSGPLDRKLISALLLKSTVEIRALNLLPTVLRRGTRPATSKISSQVRADAQ